MKEFRDAADGPIRWVSDLCNTYKMWVEELLNENRELRESNIALRQDLIQARESLAYFQGKNSK